MPAFIIERASSMVTMRWVRSSARSSSTEVAVEMLAVWVLPWLMAA